ncbi:RNA-binding S4 domain-containing protein [Devosia nitrariae]|uniref:RNA-binding S4 domain-containing protein n=1 Tax=Devosia nitrariae TaxID=2071872 RepID=UPI0024E12634|nr:RNA-binding S4 domain-containing protein [Devosia nitrariae]
MGAGENGTNRRERLDRFLFFARAVKSRTLAQKLIETGAVRVNSERTTSSDRKVGAGDVLTMQLRGRILVWRILDPGTRRGPASEAQTLYQDISPPAPDRPDNDPVRTRQ